MFRRRAAETIMFAGHDPYLVALSVVIAILGGYTGFGLAARIRGTPEAGHRLSLAGAAFFLAIGIWTMHFVGMLAAPLPAGAVYLVLPTIVSFLICALVVGDFAVLCQRRRAALFCACWPRRCCSASASPACIMSACTVCRAISP